MGAAILLAAGFLGASCTTGGAPIALPSPTGPPGIRPDVVAEHAEQFDEEVPVRQAGSQREFVAATYITGHLQQAGYIVRLESVPVANAVRSSDVIALPPSGGEPAAVVTVTYDTDPGLPAQGRAIGGFLELARALRVSDENDDVEFAALGADAGDDRSGARRLISLLKGGSAHPEVIQIVSSPGASGFAASGYAAPDLMRIAGTDVAEVPQGVSDPFAEAGLRSTVVAGNPAEVGRVLLEYLNGGPG